MILFQNGGTHDENDRYRSRWHGRPYCPIQRATARIVAIPEEVREAAGCLGSQEQKLALMVAVENVAGTAEISDHVSVTPHYLGGV